MAEKDFKFNIKSIDLLAIDVEYYRAAKAYLSISLQTVLDEDKLIRFPVTFPTGNKNSRD